MNDTQKNLDWIQLLRGAAAVLVVLTHARYAMLGGDSWPLANQLFTPGALGVDLFFIISGFIMCHSTARADGSPGYVARFMVRRFARVWPVYAVATLASALLLSGGIAYFEHAGNRATFWHSLAMLPAQPHVMPYFTLTLMVGWTLEFEMYFYLVFAGSMLFKRLRWFVLGSWVLLTVILAPLGRRGFDMDITRDLGYDWGYLSIVTSPFVLEFVAGVLIGWLYRQSWFHLRSAAQAWQVLGLGVAFALWSLYGGVQVTHGPADFGWPLMLMVLAMALASKTVTIPVPPLLLWLGAISYSLYLTHIITQGLLTRWLENHGMRQFAHSWGFMFISTAVALPVAALSHHYLEQGLSDAVRRALMRLLRLAPAEPVAVPAPARQVRRA